MYVEVWRGYRGLEGWRRQGIGKAGCEVWSAKTEGIVTRPSTEHTEAVYAP